MRATLVKALDLMFGHEGGYVNAKTDRGGPTKYGITQKTLSAARGRAVTIDDVKALPQAEAAEIYVSSYWTQSGGDLLPVGLDYAAFDFGVNSGPARAVKTLQRVVGMRGADVDGVVGVQTLDAVQDYPAGVIGLIEDYCAARMAFLRSIGGPQGFSANGRGWTIRVTGKDPTGAWKPVPGVIGNARRLVFDSPRIEKATLPIGGAKAVPPPAEPVAQPDVYMPAGAAVVVGTIASQLPLSWAVPAAILIVAMLGIGGLVAWNRIRNAET